MPSSTLTISEIYGGGGNTGATYKNDYVVIHNETGAAISLDGYSLQYVSATGAGAWSVDNLTGTIAAGGYYLAQEAAGASASAVALSNPDHTGALTLAATAGKVALVDGTAALSGASPTGAPVVDLVGFGPTATGYEGAPTPALSNTTGLVRGDGGNTDTDNNSSDFAIVTVDSTHVPNSSATAPHPAGGDVMPPTLLSSSPAENMTGVASGAALTLTFSEAVKLGAGTITLTDDVNAAGSETIAAADVAINGATLTVTPPAALSAGDSYHLTLDGTAVTDIAGNAYAGGAIDFTVAAAATSIPGGSQSAQYAISTPGAYELAAGLTLTETGSHPAISAKVTAAGLTTIDIEGAVVGATGQNGVTTAVTNGAVTIGAAGSITATDGKGVNFNEPTGGAGADTVVNLGSVVSHSTIGTPSASAGGTQPSGDGMDFGAAISPTAGAVDHTSGGTITNGAAGTDTTATIQSDSADAIGLGSNQTVTNYGAIVGDGKVNDSADNNPLAGGSDTKHYAASRGIEINGGSHDTVDNFGTITGSQHGVDGGDAAVTDLVVINEAGATITGHNGSGVGSDATSASATNVQVTNSGTITGASDPMFDRSGAASRDGDGDGVDVDGGATILNTAGAVIQGTGAAGFDSEGRANHSEGLALGGGSVHNYGAITGADSAITVNNDTSPDRSGVAATTIVNESGGAITGQDGYAIRLENKQDGADADTITNHGAITGGGSIPDPTGTAALEGGGADLDTVGTLNGVDYTAGEAGDARFVSGDGAAVQMGEGNDTLVNDGTIDGAATGRAISLEGGDDTLTLYAEGHVTGGIDGGAGADTLTLTAHAVGSTQTLAGVTGVETLHVQEGAWTVADAEAYASGATIDAGAVLQLGAGATTGAITAAIVDSGTLSVDRSDTVMLDGSVTGAGALSQIGAGVTELGAAHGFSGVNLSAGVLDVQAAGGAGAGAITFGGAAATLHVETAALTAGDFSNRLAGFAAGDTLDVAGLGANATATLGANNLLTVTDGTTTDTFHFDPAQSFAGTVFQVAADGTGGADITLAAAANAPTVLFSDDFTGFTAAGFAPGAAASTGELDSNVWRVVGLSDDANPAYGFTGPAAGDFGRGVLSGTATSDSVSTAGVYSPADNHALVVQPTGTELEAGGFIEARIANTSGAAANPPTVSFDWVYRNDEPRADNLQLSYSTDGTNFTAVAATDFSTPAAADAPFNADFSTQHETATLDGVNLAAGADLYLRWTHLGSTGSGNRDEVGIDNVEVTAQSAAPVNGTAFSISALDATHAEGDAGATPFTFTVTRAGDASAAGMVDYAVAGAGAHPADAADFAGGVLPTGTLSFAAGQTSALVTVNVAGDSTTETDETFAVGLSNPTGGATVAGSAAVGTIQNDDNSIVPIYTIQGASQHSPFAGQQVTTEGVVTAIDTTGSKGFYIQAENGGDHDANTSDAIFVYTNAAPTIHVGDLVQVAGAVDDYQGTPGAELTPNNLPLTEIDTSNAQVTFESAGHTIAPTIIGEGGLTPPTGAIAADGFATYDPTKYAADFYESLEGMVVTVKNAQAVDNTFSGETYVVPDDGADSPSLNARGGVTITEPTGADAAHADYAPERIEVYSDTGVLAGGVPSYDMGDHLGDVTGVVSYYGGNYELLPTQAPTITTGQSAPADDTTLLHTDATHLTIGAYNVDNLGPTSSVATNPDDTAAKYAALGHDIATNLGGPAILGIEEIQDADGEGPGTDYSGTATLTQLTGAITAAGGPDYQFVEVAPTANNANGGVPNGNIRSAFLYDASKVSLVAGSVRPIDDPAAPYDQAGGTYHNSREPLAADFTFNGQTITVIDVHQYSRGGSDELYGQDQPPVISGDDRRTAQADAVLNYVQGLEAANPDAKIVVEGDFNGFYFEKALADLGQTDPTTGEPTLVNLVKTLPANERYSYNFEGDSEQLDNLLVTPNLAGGALFDDVHVNTGNLAQAATSADGSGAASDHDPILAQLTLGASTMPGGGDTTPGGGGGDTMPGGGGGGTPGTVQTGGGSPGVLQGGAGDDTLTAGPSQDTLLGGDGADHLNGGSGHAQLFGNMGDDVITLPSTAQESTVFGGQGNDAIDASASTHADYLSGDVGDDVIRAGAGGDTALGGDGADTLVSGAGRDGLFGNAGDDHITIGATSQGAMAYGGMGNDVIDASASNAPNSISGDVGNDTILSGAGFETVLGGQGDDSIVGGASAGPGSMQVLLGNQGNDHLSYAGAGGVELFGGQDGDTISLTATQAGQIRYAFGNLGDDTLTASGGADSLYGGQGDDVVSAANDAVGRNYLSGDLGDDALTSSIGGSDTLHGGSGADTITLTAHAAAESDTVVIGAGESASNSAADESDVQHILGFATNSDHIVLSGHAALSTGAGGNLTIFADTAAPSSEAAAFQAAYTYAYGDGASQQGRVATEYLAVQETYGGTTSTYLFTADHHVIAFVGASAGGLQNGDVLAG